MKTIIARLLPERPDVADDLATRDRLLVQISLITLAYFVIYALTSLAIGYAVGVALMSACAVLLVLMLALFHRTGRFRICVNLLLANCLLVGILGCTLFSGGGRSPVLPWTIVIPVCSVILLGLSTDTLAWLVLSCAFLIAMPLAAEAGHSFPELYDLRYRVEFSAICDLGLITILFVTAATFYTNRNALIARLRAGEEAQQEANHAIRKALEIKTRAVQEQRNFLGMISHEFRTPLGIISGAASVLSLTPDSDGHCQAETDKVFRAVRRMEDMIELLTDDDWLELAATEFSHAPVDLKDLVKVVMADAAPPRPISLSAQNPLVVNGDPKLLGVVFASLIGNADKFSPPSTPIEVRMSRDNGMARAEIVDYGAGIEPGDIPHVFEKYYRSSSTEHRPGTGLGLYLVKRIVERHSGSISVESSPGRGATFTVRLPLSESP